MKNESKERIGNEFVISREFDAPRLLVWKVCSEAEHLKKWFCPAGFTMPTCTLDLRPGGIFHYSQRSADGNEMWGKWVFREIVAPERMVLIQCFSDKNGGVTRAPFVADWPLETLSTMLLTERAGRTTLTIRWAPYNATETESNVFDSSHAGMQQGWGGTFAQLTEYLAQIQKEKTK
jgi:uncharacterized protein YndB with AHSA1/START domain